MKLLKFAAWTAMAYLALVTLLRLFWAKVGATGVVGAAAPIPQVGKVKVQDGVKHIQEELRLTTEALEAATKRLRKLSAAIDAAIDFSREDLRKMKIVNLLIGVHNTLMYSRSEEVGNIICGVKEVEAFDINADETALIALCHLLYQEDSLVKKGLGYADTNARVRALKIRLNIA